MFYLKKIFVVFILSFLFALNLNAADKSIIATYADSWGNEPKEGWQHYTNANGEIGDSNNYIELKIVEKQGRRSKSYYYSNKEGILHAGTLNNIVPGTEDENFAKYAITAYKFHEAFPKNIWLTNINVKVAGRSDINCKIYLNDNIIFEKRIKRSNIAECFNLKVGEVKKGDAIYFASSSAEKKLTGYSLYYTIEFYKDGVEPPEAANILTPPITAKVPKLDPAGRPQEKYVARHKAHLREALEKDTDMAFIGDSITDRWSQEMLDKYFGKYRPVNFGIGGDWIQNVLWRIDNGVFDQVKPEYGVILIGTNNISSKYSPEEIAEGVKAVIDLFFEKSPESKIILMGIFPRGRHFDKKNPHAKVRKINSLLKKYADNQKVYFLDIGDKLIEPDGSITKEMMKDGLHIGTKGFTIWGEELSAFLKNIAE